MKLSLKSKVEGVNSVDPANTHLHGFIKVVSSIHANTYDKHDYNKMIDICAHLNTEQKILLFKLLEKYKGLFFGKLGKITCPPVEIKVKRGSFQSPAYIIPQAFLQLAKNEITDLVEKGVSVKGKESSLKSPSFFRKKKDGGIRFVSDLQKLNEVVERDAFAFPFPVIDDIVWKMD